MKITTVIIISMVLVIFIGCQGDNKQLQNLKSKIGDLETELDQQKNNTSVLFSRLLTTPFGRSQDWADFIKINDELFMDVVDVGYGSCIRDSCKGLVDEENHKNCLSDCATRFLNMTGL